MSVLKNSKRELFCQGLARGLSATAAYVSAGYAAAGAGQSAGRLLKNAEICSRLSELQATIAAGTIALEISARNSRIQALQARWDLMRQVMTERGRHADFLDVPGGSTGLLVKDYKGKDANQPIYRVDTGLLAELRLHEKQAAQELGQWSEEKETEGAVLDLQLQVVFVAPPAKPE